jgi:3-(3-hydroxy-phenyl)propionate hydroxylase
MSIHKREIADVAVVGAGPVGLALSSLLLRQGLTVVLLDRGRYGVLKPRATHLDDESVRIMQAMGVADELEPEFYVPSPFSLYDSDWNQVAGNTLRKEIGDQAWRYDYMFHQPTFENRVREIVAASPAITTYYGVDVVGVAQDSEHATVHARDLDAGSDFSVDALFVVGCDGAHSIVQSALGAGMEDLHGTQRWVVIDLLINEGVSVEDQLHTYATSGPGRTYTFVPTGEQRRRIEYKALEHETDESLERDDTVWDLVSKWVTPDTAVLERADTYEFNAVIANRWRNDRLFIAGDAAHQMPPKAGQGLCTGLRDAANLAWKLAFCVRGQASTDLLDTYESERSPHARLWIQISNGIARAIEALAAGEAPEIAGEQNPESRPPIGPGLHGTTPPPAGLLSFQPFLPNGTRLDDRTGLHFAVIARSALLEETAAAAREIWDQIDAVVLDSADASYDGWLDERGLGAVVIRPDRYIFGTAVTASDLADLTARLKDALGSGTTEVAGATSLT